MRYVMYLVAVMTFSMYTGCGQKVAAPSSAATRMTNTGAAPTVADCEELGKNLEKALRTGDAYWTKVTIGLREEKYNDVMAWMKKLVEKFDETLALDELTKTEIFAGFGKSKEFVELKKWYGDRQKKKE